MKFSKKTLFSIIKKVFYFGIIAFIVSIGIFSGVFFAYIDTAGKVSSDQLKIKDSKTVLYDATKKEFEVIYGNENREWVDLNQIPDHLQQAFIAIEDERFYLHHGIDFRRIASAVFNALKPGGQMHGASTITQQLVKNLTGDDDFSLKRKVQEQWRAIQLEKDLTKEQILELYLNIVPLNNGINGVQAAAKTYFGKDVSELTVAESASIAAITKYPVYYDPITKPENNRKRQENILYEMKEQSFIDDTAYQSALAEQLHIKKNAIEKVSNHSYFTDQVINDVIRDLQLVKGYSKIISEKMVYGGGLKIYSTVDSRVQTIMDNYYTNSQNFISSSSDNPFESAMVILDPKTGEIRGLIGGIGQKKGQRTLNRATQTLRQPGSSIKPIAVYAPAIEKQKITANTIVNDSRITINKWTPDNSDNSFMGNITVRTAVKKSRNIPAVKVLQMIGLDTSYSFLKKLGISSLSTTDKNYAALSLGGLYKGVSPLEMAAAYAPFVNNGVYIKPHTYLKVVDNQGNILLDNSSVDSKAVFSELTAFKMTDLLTDVVKSGTGTLARLSKMPSAGKTGTTDKNTDKWFVGYTPYYVGAVWYGYEQPKPLPGSTLNSALTTWKSIMEQVHSKLPYKDFYIPSSESVSISICTVSGKRATDLCAEDDTGSKVAIKNFAKGSQPTEECDVHKEVDICNISGKLATPYCPSKDVETKSMTNIENIQNCDIHGPKLEVETTDNTTENIDENEQTDSIFDF